MMVRKDGRNILSIQSDEWGSAYYIKDGRLEMHPHNLLDLAEILKRHNAKMDLFCVMAYKTPQGIDIPFTEKYPECAQIIKNCEEFIANLHGWTHCLDTNLDKMNSVYFWREWDDLINKRSFSYEYQNKRMQKAIKEFISAFGHNPKTFVSGGYCHTATTEQILVKNKIYYIPTPHIPYGHNEYKLNPPIFLEPFTEKRKVKLEGQQSLLNPKVWWSNRIINSVNEEKSAELEKGDEKYLETKTDHIARIILDEWTQNREVAMNIHQYNFLYKKGTNEYAFNGIIFIDKLLIRLEDRVPTITYLTSYEYGQLEKEAKDLQD